jgi:hypothetical protein
MAALQGGVVTEVPQTQYATFGEDHIAYLVFGGRGVDLLWVPPTDSTVGPHWEPRWMP